MEFIRRKMMSDKDPHVHRVSGVPYEVQLVDQYMNDISELERENFMLRARIQRLEEELARFEDDRK
jgi:hypothetical protein